MILSYVSRVVIYKQCFSNKGSRVIIYERNVYKIEQCCLIETNFY